MAGAALSQLINAHPDTFAAVQIHHGDNYATTWGNARANFYTDFAGYPTIFFDGKEKHEGEATYAQYLAKYNLRQAVPTDVFVSITATFVSGHTYNVTVNVCIESSGTAKTMKVYLVQVLDYWPTVVNYSRNGFKQSAFTHGQEPVVTVQPGQCQQVQTTLTFDTDSWNNQEDIKLIAWAQENQSSSPPSDRAEILNAAISPWPFISDCNDNDIPDQCDIDCGLEGCDVPGCGESDDCDGNGVPDECQPDCNENGVADPCDISGGVSEDCQEDGIPDECQLEDNDCNANEVPDECDISSGSSDDCDGNDVPDDCQPDCNGNDVADPCDITSGFSEDCQVDGIPDDCQLEGNDCNENAVPDECDLTVPLPISWDNELSSDPGWTKEGNFWAYGHPTGGGTHNHDPSNGYTGVNVYGYRLTGDYFNNMATTEYLTTTAIDCTDMFDTQLRFWRWLGVEQFDRANIQVSNNGTDWTEVWVNPSDAEVSDAAWTQVTYDISAVADDQPTVYIRWGMGPTDHSTSYPGWNIDDVSIVGVTYTSWDCNANDVPDECDAGFANLAEFVAQLLAETPDPAWLCIFDKNGDGVLDGDDIQGVVDGMLP